MQSRENCFSTKTTGVGAECQISMCTTSSQWQKKYIVHIVIAEYDSAVDSIMYTRRLICSHAPSPKSTCRRMWKHNDLKMQYPGRCSFSLGCLFLQHAASLGRYSFADMCKFYTRMLLN